jgi:hypothetical protein
MAVQVGYFILGMVINEHFDGETLAPELQVQVLEIGY